MQKIDKKRAISELLNSKIKSRAELMAVKRNLAKKYNQPILSHSEILKEYKELAAVGAMAELTLLKQILRKRAVRTLSGIAPVAVLTKPYSCPGRCVYCPTEKGVPQSYLSNEPAVMRAIRCNYEPYRQVQLRLAALEANGHEPTKIELIVIGGTWSVLPAVYKYWYITECFRAANNYESRIMNYELRIKNQSHNSLFIIHNSIKKIRLELAKEQLKNETARYRIIGLTLETRPDYIDKKELWQMRELGATRVELGVQALDDKILKLNQRGHGVSEVVGATLLLKNFGFKVTYHIMPGLPGSTAKKDLAMFKKLFTDERFQPDQLKFYPTVVTRGSLLYQWWRIGKYRPYADKVLQNLIAACKSVVPPYVRIIRLIRDIPSESIIAGNVVTNLRQVMKVRGVKCQCIRCREAKEEKLKVKSLKLKAIKYLASGGEEYFLSYESKDGKILYGFCRLRLGASNIKSPLPLLLKGAGIVRELHVYGQLVPVGGRRKIQHAGLGKRLMREAEKIARDQGYEKMAVISGVGARGYYRKFGYSLKDSYMVKSLV